MRGDEHPYAATCLHDLAGLYRAAGEYAKAEPFYEQALEIYQKVHGNEHPYVATCLHDLAGLYMATGEYAKAKPFYEQALEIYKKVHGNEHPYVALCLSNLARLCAATARAGGALSAMVEAQCIQGREVDMVLGFILIR